MIWMGIVMFIAMCCAAHAQTGRGVPLVELSTTNNIKLYTDSNGIIAFYEPGLMGLDVHFMVKSHGYEFPKDSFGYAGLTLKVVEGSKAITLQRG